MQNRPRRPGGGRRPRTGSRPPVIDRSAVVTEIYAAREEIPPDLSGKAVVDAAAEARPGMPVGWAPEVADGARIVAAWAVPGDVVLVVGAGDVDRAVPLVLEALR